MIIEQTVTIPADHWVSFEFLAPREIPEGLARVELKVTPVAGTQNRLIPEPGKNQAFLKAVFPEGSATPISDSLLGILSNPGDINLEEIREERLAKYK